METPKKRLIKAMGRLRSRLIADLSPAPTATQGNDTANQEEADGPTDSAGAPMPADNRGQPQQRSLGDILQDIRRRRDEILSQTEREEPTSQPQADQAPGQVEYVDVDQQPDDQALGPAGSEEQKLSELNILDDDMDVDVEWGLEDNEEQEAPIDHKVDPAKPQQSQKVETSEHDKALTRTEIGGRSAGEEGDDRGEGEEAGSTNRQQIQDVDASEDIDLVNAELAPLMNTSPGEDIWRQYSALTSDLSYALCEQLRLILEPTLATRLQGDFRTGKRLNMRKIIPYIASEYTKDKIWLRRTKPSRREYQVLLSLDDSRSMAESHSVHLAYQTLALVSQALNKLEVGQVSIAKFGQNVEILHPFGETTFTDQDGAKVMSSFKFDQHKTNVAALMERTISFMAEARQRQMSSSAPDLWQLEIIISDGVCQDHHKLRTLLRRAVEERVMIVFLIVDSLQTSTSSSTPTQARPSILSMQTVAYKQVNGEMQLEMERYLDTFPFEFYVVLRDVEALPGVLADTLRQWMARVSQSEE